MDSLPRDLWHNVLMANALALFAPPNPAFAYDWQTVERGVPISALDEFAAYSGLPVKALLEIVIPARTLKHRKQRQEPLSVDETDRLRRVARIFDLTVRVYGDAEDARRWLTKPKRRFNERTPMTLLRTQAGEDAVQEFLVQIEEGMYI
jgi:putative toxin-antitoxin system antitoxin component (TIGR02293 family)